MYVFVLVSFCSPRRALFTTSCRGFTSHLPKTYSFNTTDFMGRGKSESGGSAVTRKEQICANCYRSKKWNCWKSLAEEGTTIPTQQPFLKSGIKKDQSTDRGSTAAPNDTSQSDNTRTKLSVRKHRSHGRAVQYRTLSKHVCQETNGKPGGRIRHTR